MLRYQESNELHRDFHGSTHLAIHYLAENYGVEAAKGVLRKTGREVYKSIHDKLADGDDSELVEHLSWFANREGARYRMEVAPDEVVFEMIECPAIRHLRKLGITPDELTCLQTSEINAGMCEGTPWESSLEILGEGHCIQRFKKVRGQRRLKFKGKRLKSGPRSQVPGPANSSGAGRASAEHFIVNC